MSRYTEILLTSLKAASPDDDFVEKLLDVARLFRPLSEALDEFISAHGYTQDISDIEAKVAFIRETFDNAEIPPPRQIRQWYVANQPIKRETAFRICFAFGLDGVETDDFFRRVYARERGFDCHDTREAVYYFCLNNALSFRDAVEIISRVPKSYDTADAETVRTDSIIAELNGIVTKEQLIEWLEKNAAKFAVNNVTAYDTIKRLWETATRPDGLLLRERAKFISKIDDAAGGRYQELRHDSNGVKLWDAYLGILQLDRKRVSRLATDRSIKPILSYLHSAARDSFPDRQGIDMILHGKRVSYERVRKWLVLLTFYTFWAKKALDKGDYAAGEADCARCISSMNQHLMECGYPELYLGNPYDWIFLYASRDFEPLPLFREIWNSLLGMALESSRNPAQAAPVI